MNKLQVMDRLGRRLAQKSGEDEVIVFYPSEYQAGDYLLISTASPFIRLKVDQAIAEALLYIPTGNLQYRLPLGDEALLAYPPHAFCGNRHLISVRSAAASAGCFNVAFNPADQRGETTAYPHVSANVETRDESTFAARNVIDGCHLSDGHGGWPYQSWGIGARADAQITLTLGRAVRMDKLRLFLRADFPHDAYWIQATVVLSDGFTKTFALQKTADPQEISLDGHEASWLRLEQLVKNDDPSAFPALKQMEVDGWELER